MYGEHKAVKRDRVFFIFSLERVCLHLKRLDFVVNVGKQIAARLNPELDTRTSGEGGTNGEVVHDAPSTVDFQKDQQARTQKHIIYTNTESFVVGWVFCFFVFFNLSVLLSSVIVKRGFKQFGNVITVVNDQQTGRPVSG